MIYPMKNYLRAGLIHFMAYPEVMKGEGPILETLKAILKDDYFDAVEVTWMKDPAVREKARDLLRTSHISVAYGAQPRLLTTGLNINDLNPDGRQAAVRILKEGMEEAVYLGAEGFAFLSGHYEEARKEEAYAALLSSTQELCAFAREKGCPHVTLEVFDYDVDKASLIGPAPLAKRFAEDMAKSCDNFGLLVDLSHLPLVRESPEEAILPVREHLVHAHIGNCVVRNPSWQAYGDAHPRFGFPGGENDAGEVAAFLRVLLDIGFLNTQNPPILSFEVKPFGQEDPELVIANAKRTLNRAWAML